MPATPLAPLGDGPYFDPLRSVSDEILADLLHQAGRAPSPFNLQPWRFVVVRNERNRRRLQACAYRQPGLAEAPVAVIVLGYHHPHRSHLDAVLERSRSLGAISDASAAERRARATRALERTADLPLWTTRASLLATGLLIAAAESRGLASLLIDEFESEKIKEAFGVPDDHTICALVALGFAAGLEPDAGRLGLTDLCYAEHFGQPWAADEAE